MESNTSNIPKSSQVPPPGKAKGTISAYKISERPKRERGLKYFNVMITISTNYRPKNEDDYLNKATKLEEILYMMFNPNSMDQYVIDFIVNPRTGEDHTGDKWSVPYIVESNTKWGIELGGSKVGGRLHSHVLLEVTHRSCIWANATKIKAFVDSSLNDWVKGSYVHISAIKGAAKSILSYIRKDQPLSADEIVEASHQLNPTKSDIPSRIYRAP